MGDPGPIKRLTAGAAATPWGRPIDVEGYVRLANFFRGEAEADSMIPPFCYWPLVPCAASVLPAGALTSINIVNLLCLLLSVIVLDRLLARVGYGERGRVFGCLLFIVSFPTFYYGTIGFIDPAAVLLVALGAHATLRSRRWILAAVVVIGVLVKETNAFVALLPAVRAWATGERGPLGRGRRSASRSSPEPPGSRSVSCRRSPTRTMRGRRPSPC